MLSSSVTWLKSSGHLLFTAWYRWPHFLTVCDHTMSPRIPRYFSIARPSCLLRVHWDNEEEYEISRRRQHHTVHDLLFHQSGISQTEEIPSWSVHYSEPHAVHPGESPHTLCRLLPGLKLAASENEVSQWALTSESSTQQHESHQRSTLWIS